MSNKRNPSAVVAISAVFFVKDLDDRIFPLLVDFSLVKKTPGRQHQPIVINV